LGLVLQQGPQFLTHQEHRISVVSKSKEQRQHPHAQRAVPQPHSSHVAWMRRKRWVSQQRSGLPIRSLLSSHSVIQIRRKASQPQMFAAQTAAQMAKSWKERPAPHPSLFTHMEAASRTPDMPAQSSSCLKIVLQPCPDPAACTPQVKLALVLCAEQRKVQPPCRNSALRSAQLCR